jgi:hypothetical protein
VARRRRHRRRYRSPARYWALPGIRSSLRPTRAKRLLEKAIEEGRKLNPDPETNPAQTLEQYYQFVRFAEGATPANLIKHAPDATLYKRIDQSLGYLYFISDIPLDELKGRGYFNNSLQYVDSYNSWLQGFVKSWGLYLDQPESWNAGRMQLAQAIRSSA